MKIVLDTNSLLVSIGKKSKYRPIFDAFLRNEYKLLISNDTLSEYLEIIEAKANALVSRNIGEILTNSISVIKIDIHFKWNLIDKDADDNKFADCALNGQADYLVTDDKHFKILKSIGFPFVKVLKTQDFLDVLLSK